MKTHVHKHWCLQVVVAALCIITKTGSDPNVHRCQLVQTVGCPHDGNYSALKSAKLLLYATTWVNLKSMIEETWFDSWYKEFLNVKEKLTCQDRKRTLGACCRHSWRTDCRRLEGTGTHLPQLIRLLTMPPFTVCKFSLDMVVLKNITRQKVVNLMDGLNIKLNTTEEKTCEQSEGITHKTAQREKEKRL